LKPSSNRWGHGRNILRVGAQAEADNAGEGSKGEDNQPNEVTVDVDGGWGDD